MRIITAVAILLALLVPRAALGQGSAEKVQITVIPDRTQIAPGDLLRLAIILDHQPGWHTHTHEPRLPEELSLMADTVQATSIVIRSDGPLAAYPNLAQWPTPTEVEVAWGGRPLKYEVYERRAIIHVPVVAPFDSPLGDTSLSVTVNFQACDDQVCYQPASHSATVPVRIVEAAYAQPESEIDREIFGAFPEGVWSQIDRGTPPSAGTGLGLAWIIVIGGVILVVAAVIGARMVLSR